MASAEPPFVRYESGHLLDLGGFEKKEDLPESRAVFANEYDLKLLVVPVPDHFLQLPARGGLIHEVEQTLMLIHPAIHWMRGISLSPSNLPFSCSVCYPIARADASSCVLSSVLARDASSLSLTKVQIILLGLASAVSFLEARHFSRFDLRPDNVLLDVHSYPKLICCGLPSVFASDSSADDFQSLVASLFALFPTVPPPDLRDRSFAKITKRLGKPLDNVDQAEFNLYKQWLGLADLVPFEEYVDLMPSDRADFDSWSKVDYIANSLTQGSAGFPQDIRAAFCYRVASKWRHRQKYLWDTHCVRVSSYIGIPTWFISERICFPDDVTQEEDAEGEPGYRHLRRCIKEERTPARVRKLSKYYLDGRVVPQNLEKARELAEEANAPDLIEEINDKLSDLQRVESLIDTAGRDRMEAARKGDVLSCLLVGFSFLFGLNGFPRSQQHALEYYLLGAKHGDVFCLLGDMFRLGSGFDKNMKKAINYYRLGHRMGSTRARRYDWVLRAHRRYYLDPKHELQRLVKDRIQTVNDHGIDSSLEPALAHFYNEIRCPFIALAVQSHTHGLWSNLVTRDKANFPEQALARQKAFYSFCVGMAAFHKEKIFAPRLRIDRMLDFAGTMFFGQVNLLAEAKVTGRLDTAYPHLNTVNHPREDGREQVREFEESEKSYLLRDALQGIRDLKTFDEIAGYLERNMIEGSVDKADFRKFVCEARNWLPWATPEVVICDDTFDNCLNYFFGDNGFPINYRECVRIARTERSADALMLLGDLTAAGVARPRSFKEARSMFKSAAETSPKARVRFALFQEWWNRYIACNHREAGEYLQFLHGPDAESMYRYATILEMDSNQSLGLTEALYYHTKAACHGHLEAMRRRFGCLLRLERKAEIENNWMEFLLLHDRAILKVMLAMEHPPSPELAKELLEKIDTERHAKVKDTNIPIVKPMIKFERILEEDWNNPNALTTLAEIYVKNPDHIQMTGEQRWSGIDLGCLLFHTAVRRMAATVIDGLSGNPDADRKEKTRPIILAYAKFLEHHGMDRQALQQYLQFCEPPHSSPYAQYRVGATLLHPKKDVCARDKWRGIELLRRAFDDGCLEAGYVLGGWYVRHGEVDKGLDILERAFRSGHFPSLKLYVETIRKMGGPRRDPKELLLLLLTMKQRLEHAVALRIRNKEKARQLEENLAECTELSRHKFFAHAQWKYALRLCEIRMRRREALEWINVAAGHKHRRAKAAILDPNLKQKGHTETTCLFGFGMLRICFDTSPDDFWTCWVCGKNRIMPKSRWKCDCGFVVCPICTGGLAKVIERELAQEHQ
jgi:TPR repeat protein